MNESLKALDRPNPILPNKQNSSEKFNFKKISGRDVTNSCTGYLLKYNLKFVPISQLGILGL